MNEGRDPEEVIGMPRERPPYSRPACAVSAGTLDSFEAHPVRADRAAFQSAERVCHRADITARCTIGLITTLELFEHHIA